MQHARTRRIATRRRHRIFDAGFRLSAHKSQRLWRGCRMRRVFFPAAVLVLFASCVSTDHFAPAPMFDQTGPLSAFSLPAVRFSEIHYDNTGTDAAEAIEVSGPAGTDVSDWRIVLYNGNGGASYRADTLRTTIPATCGDRGVVVVNYPVNGIQNGSPDGMALVDGAGAVVEFLSYEGVFAATNG